MSFRNFVDKLLGHGRLGVADNTDGFVVANNQVVLTLVRIGSDSIYSPAAAADT